MFEKPDFIKNPELGPDQETLEQKEETIVVPFSLEDFKLFESTVQKFREKTDDNPEKYKKSYDFALKLRGKYGKDALKYGLMHIISGSTIDGLKESFIEKLDFEGEDSIVDFIDNL